MNFGKGQEHTFFDFLGGNIDEENFNTSSNSMRAENTSSASNSVRKHREDSGFGSGNLEHLGEQPVFYQQ
jgi:hypothetical protein